MPETETTSPSAGRKGTVAVTAGLLLGTAGLVGALVAVSGVFPGAGRMDVQQVTAASAPAAAQQDPQTAPQGAQEAPQARQAAPTTPPRVKPPKAAHRPGPAAIEKTIVGNAAPAGTSTYAEACDAGITYLCGVVRVQYAEPDRTGLIASSPLLIHTDRPEGIESPGDVAAALDTGGFSFIGNEIAPTMGDLYVIGPDGYVL